MPDQEDCSYYPVRASSAGAISQLLEVRNAILIVRTAACLFFCKHLTLAFGRMIIFHLTGSLSWKSWVEG